MVSKYTREVLEEAVAASGSIAGVLRHLGVPWSGGMHAHISRRIKFFQLDTTHFTGKTHNRGREGPDRKTPEQILGRALIEFGVPYQCSACSVAIGCHRHPGLRSAWTRS
jgi:hypothetical protein